MRVAMVGLLGVAACYAPAPVEGLPCSPSGSCPAGQACVDEVCAGSGVVPDAAPDAGAVDNLKAFVSSGTRTGALGGRAGADALCAGDATDAGLSGEFIALLGTATSRGAERLDGSSGWVNTRGDRLVAMPAEWEQGEVRNPVRYLADGTDPGDVALWRGGNQALTCGDWSATGGDGSANFNSDGFAVAFEIPCAQALHLLCVEVGRRTPLPPAPVSDGKLVFVTRDAWTPGSGRADADAACVAAATAGVLANASTFKAAIGIGSGSPFARFTSSAPLIRTDGELVATSGLALFTGVGGLRSFINRDQFGAVPAEPFVWLGSANSTCADWSSSSAASSAPLGLPDTADRGTLLNPGYAGTCDDATVGLICVEP